MRSDIAPGGTFPDYELPDHENVPRKLSELQGDDPLILTLARGHYCPKEHQQHLQLAAFYPQIAVAYTQIVTISTDAHHESQEFRASVGAQWPFLSDPERIVQKDLDIQEYTDPEHDPMIPHTLVLKPGLVIHSIYNGYWFWGRPSVEDLRRDLRAVTREIRPDWDLSTPGLRDAWDAGDHLALPRLEQAGRHDPEDGVRIDQRVLTVARHRAGLGLLERAEEAGSALRLPERPVDVVVEPDRCEPAALAPDEDAEPGLRRQLHPAPPDDVVLQRAGALAVDQCAGLERDAAAVRKQRLKEVGQAVRTPVEILVARRLAKAAVRLECGEDRVDVAGRERTPVLGHDVRRAQLRIGLQQGLAVHVAAGQGPAAVVDAQLVNPSVGLLVGHDRDRKIDSPGLTVEVENHLLETARHGNDALDVLDLDVALAEPRVGFDDVGLERPSPPDASAHGVVNLGLAGE